MATYEVNTYDVGQEVRSDVDFTVAGVLTDPTTITFMFLDPSGTTTTWVFGVDPEVVQDGVGEYHADWTTSGSTPNTQVVVDPEVVQDGVGEYHADWTLDEEGGWYYRWEGTGTVIAAAERYFEVRESKFYP